MPFFFFRKAFGGRGGLTFCRCFLPPRGLACSSMESSWNKRGYGSAISRSVEVWVFGAKILFKEIRLRKVSFVAIPRGLSCGLANIYLVPGTSTWYYPNGPCILETKRCDTSFFFFMGCWTMNKPYKSSESSTVVYSGVCGHTIVGGSSGLFRFHGPTRTYLLVPASGAL